MVAVRCDYQSFRDDHGVHVDSFYYIKEEKKNNGRDRVYGFCCFWIRFLGFSFVAVT
jgi:hypothetical protein